MDILLTLEQLRSPRRTYFTTTTTANRRLCECSALAASCESFCKVVEFHQCKEIENFLLVPSAIDRSAKLRLDDQNRRTGKSVSYKACAEEILSGFSSQVRDYVTAQCLTSRRRFERTNSPSTSEETVTQNLLSEIGKMWNSTSGILQIIPGKEALSAINRELQARFGVSVTPTGIVDAMTVAEIPDRMKTLISKIDRFVANKVEGGVIE